MRQRHPGGPRGVVGLHRDEPDVEIGAEPLQLVHVDRDRLGLEGIVRPADRDTLTLQNFDLLGPRIHQGDLVAGPREERAQVAADRTRADEEHSLGHLEFLLVR
jgi:hypothetical protein